MAVWLVQWAEAAYVSTVQTLKSYVQLVATQFLYSKLEGQLPREGHLNSIKKLYELYINLCGKFVQI